jgi:hypothetical protein
MPPATNLTQKEAPCGALLAVGNAAEGCHLGAGGSCPAWTACRPPSPHHLMQARRSTGRRRLWPCCRWALVRYSPDWPASVLRRRACIRDF